MITPPHLSIYNHSRCLRYAYVPMYSMYRLLESPYVPVHVFAENESVAVAREIISSVTLIILSLGLIKQGALFDT